MREGIIWLVAIVGLSVVVGLLIEKAGDRGKYPAPETLEREGGNIKHPTYGDYPEAVPYKQGMTLMPGQSTTVGIGIPMQRIPDSVQLKPPGNKGYIYKKKENKNAYDYYDFGATCINRYNITTGKWEWNALEE